MSTSSLLFQISGPGAHRSVTTNDQRHAGSNTRALFEARMIQRTAAATSRPRKQNIPAHCATKNNKGKTFWH